LQLPISTLDGAQVAVGNAPVTVQDDLSHYLGIADDIHFVGRSPTNAGLSPLAIEAFDLDQSLGHLVLGDFANHD
jgi:hypothetical protein